MRILQWNSLSRTEQTAALCRPALRDAGATAEAAQRIIDAVRQVPNHHARRFHYKDRPQSFPAGKHTVPHGLMNARRPFRPLRQQSLHHHLPRKQPLVDRLSNVSPDRAHVRLPVL